ncbi:MAG: hypothetical protein RIR49_566 [Actinomycetota bacterium]|jgi:Mlc titration factor MtfA (ptsG expression regulator)
MGPWTPAVTGLCAHLDDAGRERHRAESERLHDRIRWETPDGFDLDTAMRETVVTLAALLAAGFAERDDPFAQVRSVIVHPGAFRVSERRSSRSGGIVRAGGRSLAGQSGHGRGPLVISWSQVRADLRRPSAGRNVVLHEFAHKIDQLDGFADGLPPIADGSLRRDFDRVMGRSFDRVRRSRQGLLRAYAGSDPAEHFAVASEVFFTRPVEMRSRAGGLYRALSAFYRQDPASPAGPLAP